MPMCRVAWLAVASLAFPGAAASAQTPRHGGAICMTAPYAASFGSLDPHATPRVQDDIVNTAIHRTLYNWDSGKPVLGHARSVSISDDGLVHTYRLRDDAYFHNGQKMTAERVDPGDYLFVGSPAIPRREEVDKGNFAAAPIGPGPFKFKEHVAGRRVVAGRFDRFYKPGKPHADRRVRQAINHAIDSGLIVKLQLRDKAYRAVSWLPPASPVFDTTMKPYAYDPAKAMKLLAGAGYANGFEFELTTSQNESWGLPIVEAIVPMLAKVGITPKPELVEMARLAEIAMKGDHQAVIGSTPTGPDALAALPCFYSRTARTACNYTSFDDAARTGDPGRRLGLLKQANPTGITRQYPEDIWIDAKSQAK